MNTLPDLRTLYWPVQPTVKHTTEGVTYLELLPAPGLFNYIYCYWQLKTTEPLLEPFHYRVVADGCMDIFFEVDNPQSSFVMGFSNAFTEFPLEHTFNYIGVRFLPGMFPLLFNISAVELVNNTESLQQVVPLLATFLEITNAQNELATIKLSFDLFFLQHLSRIL